MALLLNIDTATEHASVCLSKDGAVLAFEESKEQKNHASFLQPAIQKISETTGISLSLLDAIAVTEGPGSYTGLRVGMASAKGLCYALNKPLILLNTLKVMAAAAVRTVATETMNHKKTLLCPMIDARRMEVFTAVFDMDLNTVMAPAAVVLDGNSFAEWLNNCAVLFSGNGHMKFKDMIENNANALFSDVAYSVLDMVGLAENAFSKQEFANLAYSEPFYLKEFFSPEPKKNVI